MIRDLASGDLESVAKMLSNIREAAPWSTDDFRLASRRNLSLRVAEEDGAVCGLIVFRTIADEVEIMNLAVDSSRRRRGAGSRLLEDVIRACKGAGVRKIFLEVRDSNEAARNFYSRMGFTEAGRRRQYYRQPVEDALVLVRKVEQAPKKS
jgi:[ribosomal protein S18]-alanine N-acetyltransferase